ncbi:sugar phosphate isomerase/epimerase [soil metagenome]
MRNRRRFLKQTGVFALGSLLLPACTTPQGENTETTEEGNQTSVGAQPGSGNIGPFGLQLYSIRDIFEEDIRGNLQRLSNIGYEEAESWPGKEGHYYGMEPREFKKMMDDVGMELVSSHFGSGTRNGESVGWQKATLLQNFDALVEKAAQTGQRYLTCSSLDQSLRKTPDDIKFMADVFNKAGEKCRQAGMTFAYHNHDFEFQKVGDIMIYDYLLENTDPDLVKYELDMFWLVRGEHDLEAYLKNHPNRFPLGHVKDMHKEDKTRNAELGQGLINYQEILRIARDNGMDHFLVEQETYTNSSMESMEANAEYMSRLTI